MESKLLLASISKDLRNISKRLNRLSDGINSSFVGIGNDRCASRIKESAQYYSILANKLDNVNIADTEDITSHVGSSGGGHGGGGGRDF